MQGRLRPIRHGLMVAAGLLALCLAGCTGTTSTTSSASGPPELRVLTAACGHATSAPGPSGSDGVIGEPTEWPSWWRATCGSGVDVPSVDFKHDLVLWYFWDYGGSSHRVAAADPGLETLPSGLHELVVPLTRTTYDCAPADARFSGYIAVVDRYAFDSYRFAVHDERVPCEA